MPKMFLVGGAVRDQLLGLKPKDLDYTVVANSFEEMTEWLMREKQAEIFLEKEEYGTVRARIPGDLAADFVLARKDGYYTDGRRPDRTEPGTLLDDLRRRDFTVNAIARDEDGVLIDPFGGQLDLEKMLLRTVRAPQDTFSEDALRLYRAVRFLITKDFRLTAETLHAMRTVHVLDKLENVSIERIREELHKCFQFSTLKTISVLQEHPTLLRHALKQGLWLEPTLKGH